MKPCAAALGLTLAVALPALTAAPVSASKSRLTGTWKARAMTANGKTRPLPRGMTMTMELRKDGLFIGRMETRAPGAPPHRTVEKGTWEVEGKILVTRTAAKTDRMTYVIKDRELTLTRAGRSEALILTR